MEIAHNIEQRSQDGNFSIIAEDMSIKYSSYLNELTSINSYILKFKGRIPEDVKEKILNYAIAVRDYTIENGGQDVLSEDGGGIPTTVRHVPKIAEKAQNLIDKLS